MRLLLDSHVAVAVIHRELLRYGRSIHRVLLSDETERVVSAASLWEMAIKNRVGKLELQIPLAEIPDYLISTGIELLDINHRHALAELHTVPSTRDPFDRMLLAQCQVEGLQLVTVDRALIAHPLAWRAP